MAAAKVEPDVVELPPQSPNAVLADAARAVAVRRLGRMRRPVAVTVHLDEHLDLERVVVEVVGTASDDESLSVGECFRDVTILLARTGHRLTTTQVFAGLDAQGTPHGEGPVKATLAAAVRDGLLTSNPKSRPHAGYGLPGWP